MAVLAPLRTGLFGALALLLCATARADVVTFQITNVHWRNTTYIGNSSMPLVADWYGTGSFSWTYSRGTLRTGTARYSR